MRTQANGSPEVKRGVRTARCLSVFREAEQRDSRANGSQGHRARRLVRRRGAGQAFVAGFRWRARSRHRAAGDTGITSYRDRGETAVMRWRMPVSLPWSQRTGGAVRTASARV
ncbi:hypothetical protein GCM10009550_76050 [Actinocorallia libanotica]|uniref:Uncharacterized protein n=1 Tax=Actinocorallia libanotica TaxID=46162 RepID=A0ABP4CKT1_9ACTN